MEKKELSKVQFYAITKAKETSAEAQNELQTILNEIAIEHGLNINNLNEKWTLSNDNKYLIREEDKK